MEVVLLTICDSIGLCQQFSWAAISIFFGCKLRFLVAELPNIASGGACNAGRCTGALGPDFGLLHWLCSVKSRSPDCISRIRLDDPSVPFLLKAFNDVWWDRWVLRGLDRNTWPKLAALNAASNQGTRGSFPLSITFSPRIMVQWKMGCPSK